MWKTLSVIVPTALAFVTTAGCGSAKFPLSGAVILDERPLDDGYVSFFPIAGVGHALSGPIAAGRYKLDGIKPGRYRVLVSRVPKTDRSERPKLLPLAAIPPTAIGNIAVHEIAVGQQILDLAIGAAVPKEPGR